MKPDDPVRRRCRTVRAPNASARISGRPGSAEWTGGVLFAVALGLGLAAPVLDLLGVIDPLAFFDGLPFRVVGLAMGPCYSPNVLECDFSEVAA